MSFSDLLNSPLPSKIKSEGGKTVTESVDQIDISTDPTDEGCDKGSCNEDVVDPEVGEINDDVDADDIEDIGDDDEFDPDALSDEELSALDAELSGDAVDDVIDGDDDEETLTPEEEIEADDMMSMAATSLLVNNEMSAEEKVAFLNSDADTQIAINEGFMSDADINMMAYETGLVTEGKYNKKMIIRLDAASKKKQLYALAVNVSAAAHHDVDYIKLKKVMKMRKILRAKLDRKYHGEATKRMKIYYNRLAHSKSNALAKIGEKFKKAED